MIDRIMLSARMVFSNNVYRGLSVAVGALFWIIFNYFDGLLFFTPQLAFYYPLPEDAIFGFVLSNITAALAGLVISMNVYVFRKPNMKFGASFFSGSSLGMISSTCVSCSSLGFFLVTTFGAAGAATSTFMTNYQLPIRLIAMALLVWAYYSTHRRITKSCVMNQHNPN